MLSNRASVVGHCPSAMLSNSLPKCHCFVRFFISLVKQLTYIRCLSLSKAPKRLCLTLLGITARMGGLDILGKRYPKLAQLLQG
jgi:hypothetical protein